jgi:hypothetical protein
VACGVPPKGYANLPVRESVRKILDELRAETGIRDLSDLLVVLVRTYRDYTSAISKIQELLTSIASKTTTSSTSKADTTGEVTSTTNPSATQSKAKTEERTGASTNEGYEWCRSKAKIRNLQNFLKWADGTFGLIDWWDEGDKYCFKTRNKPAKTE